MNGTDAVLALLQDIKDILYGIALLLVGCALCIAAVIWNAALGILLLIPGIGLCLFGVLYARHGHRHHEVVEHSNETTNNND